MIYQRQRHEHRPDQGVYGDCHRTAYACVLDLPLDEVPNFGHGCPTSDEFHRRCNEFLLGRGLRRFCIMITEGDFSSWLAWMKTHFSDVVYILGARSPGGTMHSVVCRGGRVILDPYTGTVDDGTLSSLDSDRGLYRIEFFVPASPDLEEA